MTAPSVVPISAADLPRAIVEGLIKAKRVRKAIIKPNMLEKGSINLITPLNRPTNLNMGLTIGSIQPTIETIASTIPDNVPIKVKISKPRSKKGENTPIVEQIAPISTNTEPILESNAPINGISETAVVNNSPRDVLLESICEGAPKRGRGRPLGCLDKAKRRAKGTLLKPPVQHGKLGRPLGRKDSGPRRKKARLSPNLTQLE